MRGVMLNTLVHDKFVSVGSQWVVFVSTLVTTTSVGAVTILLNSTRKREQLVES
jgi:hypothetical protein